MGKSSSATVGYWYLAAFHHGLGVGPLDAFLEFRGGDKTAWQGQLTESGSISVNAPYLWGGEKDQGGIVGELEWMNGEATQQPNAYLASTFGDQQPAWRGLSTVVFKGGKFGAMNPYPQKPSYKIRKIKKGWDAGCWYEAKAAVNVGGTAEHGSWAYSLPETVFNAGHSGFLVATSADHVISFPGEFAVHFGTTAATRQVARAQVLDEYGAILWDSGWFGNPALADFLLSSLTLVGRMDLHGPITAGYSVDVPVVRPAGDLLVYSRHMVVQLADGHPQVEVWSNFDAGGSSNSIFNAMNPAHILYYALTQADMGRESTASINEASFTAAADWFYSQGFGLCTSYDPSAESVEEFQQRICKVAGCSLSRSLIDGQWYLDVANGEYTLANLPILGDDDILEFEEQPTLPDSAVNSVSVKLFDPKKKEAITTAPVQAPALIADFGTHHLTLDFQEIPTAELAARVAQRELLARITPLRAFPLKTTRKPYAWRPGTYFRLQAPKRGVADMVCIFSEKSSGQLRSGAMAISATQDVYSLPTVAFVEVEPGVDTRPDQTPLPIVEQAAFEAPYIDVMGAMTRADLAALPVESGFLLAVAKDPSTSRDYTLTVDAGAGYAATANGEWTATAIVVEEAGYLDTAFTLTGGSRLSEVEVGQPALWGDEIVRVDAIDTVAGTLMLGRGCADTVPAKHAAGTRIWFYATGFAADITEYTDGETVSAKLLTNTGSQQLDAALATPIPVTFDARWSRPYPPAALTINTQDDPAYLFGMLTVAWVHRDRVVQADQLVDQTMAGVGPEAGTTYTLRTYLDDVLDSTQSGITGTSATVTPSGNGQVRIEVESLRDTLASWQANTRTFAYTATELSPLTIAGTTVTIAGEPIYME